ncbi:hypothetical protein BsWGS_27977 [Bradybaena similaris]
MSPFILLLALVSVATQYTSAAILFENIVFDFLWGTDCTQQDFYDTGEYNPKVCQPTKFAVGEGGEIYVTISRIYSEKGVPSSLNIVRGKHEDPKTGVLIPYPSWDFNRIGNCDAIQNAVSVKTDPRNGWLYILDVGRLAILSDHPVNLCLAKIVVLDTRNGGSVVRLHELPDSVVPKNKNFVFDFVIDFIDSSHTIGGPQYAYIADTYSEQIVVFNFNTNSTHSFKHYSMSFDQDSVVDIVGQTYNFSFGVSGIALSPSYNYVYYSALGSLKLWQIPTSVLQNVNGDFNRNVRYVGDKISNSVSLVAGQRGIYYGPLEYCAVFRWDLLADMENQGVTERNVTLDTQTPLAQNYDQMQCVYDIVLSIFSPGYIIFVTTKCQKTIPAGTMDFDGGDGANFRFFKQFVNDSAV